MLVMMVVAGVQSMKRGKRVWREWTTVYICRKGKNDLNGHRYTTERFNV